MTKSRLAASLLLVGVSMIAAAFAAVTPMAKAAYACSIGSFGSPERQRAAVLESLENSDLVIVGTVVEERRVGTSGNNDVYDSAVTSEAVLAGEAPDSVVQVRVLSYDDVMCSGGPRLREGEKVLLALDRGATDLGGDDDPGEKWRVHHFLGKVAIDGEQAVSQYASVGATIGTQESLVREYGAALGSTDKQIEDAVAAAIAPAGLPQPPVVATTLAAPLGVPDGDSESWNPVWAVVAGVALAGVIAVGVRARLRRES